MSNTKFENILCKNETAISINNGRISTVILPNRGAKIASLSLLSDKQDNEAPIESLSQSNSNSYQRAVNYGMVFEGEDGTGFDDLFPNINPCTLSYGPWDNVILPDHGEVWSLPWDCNVKDLFLTCSVHGIRLPYSLEKTIHLHNNRIKISYKATNNTPFPMLFQWAAHAIFQISPGSKLIIPNGMNRIINAYAGNRLPVLGKEYDFPLPSSNSDFNLSIIPEKNDSGAQKYWFSTPVTEGCCHLINPSTKLKTTISFSKGTLPYLGIWVNEGGWNGYYNIGIEPSTCILDDPVSAMDAGKESILPANGKMEWDISIELTELNV